MGRSPVQVHRDIPALQASLEEAGIERAYADGGRTVQAFLAAGRLSDLTVTRVPVLLGGGIPLFGRLAGTVQEQLVASHATDQGAVQSVYRFPTR
jgi:dihydrofolate reductase